MWPARYVANWLSARSVFSSPAAAADCHPSPASAANVVVVVTTIARRRMTGMLNHRERPRPRHMDHHGTMHVLFATAELAPLAAVGGLAQAAAGLVAELRRQGVDVES